MIANFDMSRYNFILDVFNTETVFNTEGACLLHLK